MLSTPKHQNVTNMLVVVSGPEKHQMVGMLSKEGESQITLLDGVRILSYPVEFPEFHSAVGLLVYKLRFHIQEGDVQIAKFSYLHLFATFHVLYEIVLAFVSFKDANVFSPQTGSTWNPTVLLQVGCPGESKLTPWN